MNTEKPKKIALLILQYVLAYFLGIVVAIVFTPVEMSLVGKDLWYLYPILAIPAFILFFTQFSIHSLGSDLIFAFVYLGSIACVLFGIASHFGSLRRFRSHGPKLIGFTIGFMGTIAVYFISSSSI